MKQSVCFSAFAVHSKPWPEAVQCPLQIKAATHIGVRSPCLRSVPQTGCQTHRAISKKSDKTGYRTIKTSLWIPPWIPQPPLYGMSSTSKWSSIYVLNSHRSCGHLPHTLFNFPLRPGLRRHRYKILHATARLQRRANAFSVRIAKYWNTLPSHILDSRSKGQFIRRLKKDWKKLFKIT